MITMNVSFEDVNWIELAHNLDYMGFCVEHVCPHLTCSWLFSDKLMEWECGDWSDDMWSRFFRVSFQCYRSSWWFMGEFLTLHSII